MTATRLLDTALELPIVTSFTRIGFEARQRLGHWKPLDAYDLSGRVILVTGATSGLGRAAATQLARCGATLVLVGRSHERNQAVAAAISGATGNPSLTPIAADLADHEQVRALADQVVATHDRLDVLVHNAGALIADRAVAPDGTEATVASQVVGPFLLTSLLLDRLADAAPARVLTMCSGGMYTSKLMVSQLEMPAEAYRGTEQYARAKRAQVTLNEIWAERFGQCGIYFHALHPGWASTPGLAEALPTFSRLVGPLLRTAEQGADTLVWLAADPEALQCNGRFWLDRRVRPIHRLPATRRSDTAQRRQRLWDWVVNRSGNALLDR